MLFFLLLLCYQGENGLRGVICHCQAECPATCLMVNLPCRSFSFSLFSALFSLSLSPSCIVVLVLPVGFPSSLFFTSLSAKLYLLSSTLYQHILYWAMFAVSTLIIFKTAPTEVKYLLFPHSPL